MRTIIAGGRDCVLLEEDFELLDWWRKALPISQVVCGAQKKFDRARGCWTGVDFWGAVWARKRGVGVTLFPADWDRYGLIAGPIRNGQMAEHADALIAFPGGRGTANMVQQAEDRGLVVVELPFAS